MGNKIQQTSPLINEVKELRKKITGLEKTLTKLKTRESQLKQSEKKQRRQNRLLRSMLDCIGEGVVACDKEGNFLIWNPAAEQLLGMRASKTRPEEWSRKYGFFLPDKVTPYPNNELPLAEALRGKETRHVEIFARNTQIPEGKVLDATGSPLIDKNGKLIGGIAVFHDLSPRKRAEEALQASEKQYQTLAEISPVGIFHADADGGCVYVNKRWCEIAGISFEQALGDGWVRSLHPEDLQRITEEWYQSAKRQTPFKLEYRFLNRQGVTTWVLGQAVAELNKSGQIVGYMGTITDITERKHLQEQLMRVQKLESAGRVAGQIAHDFNNLLSPLAAYPGMIREELPKGHAALELIDEMEDAAKKIAEINQQLLSLGRRGHYAMEPVNLNELVHRILTTEKLPKDITLKEEFDPNLFLIKAGAAQLTRALTNLIKNANEAMDGRGTLTLQTENIYLDMPLRGYETIADGEYVRLSISDTGSGIRADILDNIFEPFFSTKRMDRSRGSGLGLSVVHSILEDHKGYIRVDTKLRKGTTFSLFFPVDKQPAKASNLADVEIKGGDERLLIVDDDPVQRRVASQVLRRVGYKVQAVSSGEKAVSRVKKHGYDLVIIDMVMDGIDGAEAYQQILEFEPAQKAIILSGYAMSNRVQTAIKLGAGAYVAKPISQKVLVNAVRKELDKGIFKTQKS